MIKELDIESPATAAAMESEYAQYWLTVPYLKMIYGPTHDRLGVIEIDGTPMGYGIAGDRGNVFARFVSFSKAQYDEILEWLQSHHKINQVSLSHMDSRYEGALPHIDQQMEHVVMELPKDMETYLQNTFSAKSRSHFRNYGRKLAKLGTVETRLFAGQECDREKLTILNDFVAMRQKSKGAHSLLTDESLELMVKYAPLYGRILITYLDGQPISGTLFHIVGQSATLETLTHHPKYDSCEAGQLILLDTINYCISQNVKKFDFLWGGPERGCAYKYRFGGKGTPIYCQDIFFKKTAAYWKLRRKQLLAKLKNRLRNTPIEAPLKKLMYALRLR